MNHAKSALLEQVNSVPCDQIDTVRRFLAGFIDPLHQPIDRRHEWWSADPSAQDRLVKGGFRFETAGYH